MSLRARVLAGIAVVAVVLVGAAFAVTRSTERHLVDQVDSQLRAADLPGRVGPGPGPGGPPRSGPRFSEVYWARVAPGGSVVVRAEPDLRDAPLPVVDAQRVLATPDGAIVTLASADGGFRYRALVRDAPRGDGRDVVALPLDDVDEAVARLVAIEAAATVAMLAVLGLVGWWVVRLGVRPIKQMTATATAIAAGDLSQRVPGGRGGTEAGELGDALNRMMGRIEDAFEERARSQDRLRQFVADASHELRTPITTIRGYAELHRAGALADERELGEAMRRTEQEAVRMGTLVEDLLQLARLDQGRPLDVAAVDLKAVLEDAARDAQAVDPERAIGVVLPPGPPPVVRADEGRVRQVVANLVANALVHTPSDAAVELRAGRDGEGAWIEVADRGPGMPPDVAARAFERFYRADPSRSRHKGGSGLGLAIVEATVAAHGGRVSLQSAPGEGTTVRVDLPG